MDDPVSVPSGGERQTLTVNYGDLSPTKVLLLDKHTAALDPTNACKIIALTQQFVNRMDMTTIMVTRNMDQALKIGNLLAIMDTGKIIFECSQEKKDELDVSHLIKLFADKQVLDDELLLATTSRCLSTLNIEPRTWD